MKLRLLLKLKMCMLALILLCTTTTKAQTSLSAGDIAFTGYNSDGNDSFSFILLTNISSGTVIRFTDGGWNGSIFRAGEGDIVWTAASAMSAMDVVTISQLTATSGTVTGTTPVSMSSGGDQIFAYQGTFATPTSFIAAIHMNVENPSYPLTGALTTTNGDWDGVNATPSTDESRLSGTGLTNGTNCVWLYDSTANAPGSSGNWEVDNARALCTALTGTVAQVRAKLNSRWYWEFDQGTAFAPCSPICSSSPTDYYYDGSGSINSTANWGTATDGTGANPSSFTEAGVTYHVANTSGTVNTPGNWTVGSSTGGLEIGSGIVVGINGNALTIAGALSGTGTLAGSATSDLTLTGTVGTVNFTSGASNRTLHDLTLSASTTATLGTATSITGGSSAGTVIVGSSSTLTTGGNLTLASDVNGTARIGNSAGTISGNVTVERYIPGKRAFRFLGHPFTTAQALTTLTDDIDITGSGGSTNGFTTTGTNNPSAYWYDVSTANGSASNDPGWTAFTHTNGASANSWDQYEMIRVLVRGAKTEGLTGGSYTPSATTLDMTGAVNQGTQVVSVTKGSGSIYAGVGNPFPSGVNMSLVARGGGIATFYYVWDATSGAAGAYVAKLYSGSYILPSGAGYITALSSSGTVTFEEADKASGGAALFKGTASQNIVQLIIEDSTTKWDELLINFDDNAMDVEEQLVDAMKFYNPGLDFFTLSKDDARLSIDVRPYSDSKSIPLGLTAYNRYNRYKIKTGDFDIPAGTKLFLHDKYLNKKEEMKAGFEYWFDVTTDTLSQGNQRFEINMVGKPTGIAETNANTAKMRLFPNPAQNDVKVAFDNLEGTAHVKLVSMTGQVVYSQMIEATTGSVIVPLQNVPSGIYIVSLQSKNARFTEKLIKE